MSHSSEPGREQMRAVFRILGDVRELRQDRQAWQRVAVESLCKLLGARQGTCLWLEHFRPAGPLKVREALHAGWMDPAMAAAWEAELRRGNIAADPQMVSAMRMPEPVVAVTRPQLVSDADWYAAPLVSDWMPITEIDGYLSSWCQLGGVNEVLAFTFHRDWRDPPASARQRGVLRLFMEELHLLIREGRLTLAQAQTSDWPALSPRERQVLDRLAKGDSVKQVATSLGLSQHTVTDYAKSLHKKFGVNSRGELLARVLKNGHD